MENNISKIKEKLLYKRIVEWDVNKIVLDDGTNVYFETTEQDCCAGGHGNFSNVKLDAMITDVVETENKKYFNESWDTDVNEVKIAIYHNQNPIAQAEVYTDSGNGGYYYSVTSMIIGDVVIPVAEA